MHTHTHAHTHAHTHTHTQTCMHTHTHTHTDTHTHEAEYSMHTSGYKHNILYCVIVFVLATAARNIGIHFGRIHFDKVSAKDATVQHSDAGFSPER